MKIAIFGASGIVGSHLRLAIPEGVETLWLRKEADPLHLGLDLSAGSDASIQAMQPGLRTFLNEQRPNVIINLAGESRPDVVEKYPAASYEINVSIPYLLSLWCGRRGAHYVHVSSQAVFSGAHPPYHPKSELFAVNEYGKQKIAAEQAVASAGNGWTIVRPTFVLGVRPVPTMGRQNPIESMLTEPVQKQVADRWFSISFARDVAAELWRIAQLEPQRRAIHIGIPHGVSRYDVAVTADKYGDRDIKPARHSDFPGIAERPVDTTYADTDGHCSWENSESSPQRAAVTDLQRAWKRAGLIKDGIGMCRVDLEARNSMSVIQRAKELAFFLGISEAACLARLSRGFHEAHKAVADDFRAANPQGDKELLDWYRKTEQYCWELSCYHCDAGVPAPGWNYFGMLQGVADRIKTAGGKSVLVLGDGIGDGTLFFHRQGLSAIYHDLEGSRTAGFARARYWMYVGREMPCRMTTGWEPDLGKEEFDCVASLDFLEHCKQVPVWTKAIYDALKPGGRMMCQNAFAIGSGDSGSIPMHLAENDVYEKQWDALCESIGFRQEGSNWYRRP